jgi:hypothetical protein
MTRPRWRKPRAVYAGRNPPLAEPRIFDRDTPPSAQIETWRFDGNVLFEAVGK